MQSFIVLSRELILRFRTLLDFELSTILGKVKRFSIASFERFSKPGTILPLIFAAFFKKLTGKSDSNGTVSYTHLTLPTNREV